MRPLPAVPTQLQEIRLGGGLDVVTPPLRAAPGTLTLAQNFEHDLDGGYRRIAGYERYDGRAAPSDASYTIITATVSGTISVGDVVEGGTSAATATVIARPTGEVVVTKVVGTFVNGETLKVATVVQGTITADPLVGAATTALLDATYLNAAADVYRALIGAVPGSGSILGVIQFNDVLYAWRNNVGATAAAIYKSTTSGWSAVTLYNEISFTLGGAAIPAEGATLTQGGVTATLKRAVLQSGAWASTTAAGRLIITNPAGGNFAAGAATLSGGITLTLSAVQTAITISPNGRYEFDVANFGGSVNTKRIYGADGVNRGFEFDGDIYVPITTGASTDAPTHVKEHLNYLFFSFGGSAQFSGVGTPYQFTILSGAGELAMGDTITGFSSQPASQTSGALTIFTRNRTANLYGADSADWVLLTYREELGAYPYTNQDMSRTIFLDDRGVTDIVTSQNFGNFTDSVISEKIRPRINELRPSVVASCICRDLSQYRLFFSDGIAYYFTFSKGKLLGATPIILAHELTCVWSGEATTGSEAIFFGSDDGYVYQMEKGTSFDGNNIEAYFTLAYNNSGSPRTIKSYRHLMLEVKGTAYVAFDVGYSLAYGTTLIDQPTAQSVTAPFLAAYWDSFTWDAFIWDGSTLLPSEVDIQGDAENIAISVSTNSDIYQPFTVTGAILHFTPRTIIR